MDGIIREMIIFWGAVVWSGVYEVADCQRGRRSGEGVNAGSTFKVISAQMVDQSGHPKE
jgi:hypothetical protein